jgi:hypothetical protein
MLIYDRPSVRRAHPAPCVLHPLLMHVAAIPPAAVCGQPPLRVRLPTRHFWRLRYRRRLSRFPSRWLVTTRSVRGAMQRQQRNVLLLHLFIHSTSHRSRSGYVRFQATFALLREWYVQIGCHRRSPDIE